MLSTTLLTMLALAAAPQAQDPHWYAFEGCWRATPQQEGAPLLCLKESEGELLMSTYINGELKSAQRIRANGVARPITEGGCAGDETARWSTDGARVYINAKLSCGTGLDRSTASTLALSGPETLLEVRSLKVGDGSTVRTMRYTEIAASQYPADFRLTPGRELARETARIHAAAALDLEDVVEASKLLDAGTVEALLAVRASGFALTANNLRQLKAAGVPRSTLDLMVALSYPDAFRVAEAAPRNENRAEWSSPYYDPFRMNPYYRYDCFGLDYYSSWGCDYRSMYGYGYSPYGYSPYGYSRYGGWYSPYGWNYGNGGIIIVPAGEDNGNGGSVGSRGYTSGTQPTRGTARRRGDDGTASGTRASTSPSSGGSARGSTGGSSSAGGGSVSSGGGYTTGGGSTSQGTAKPRGGGK